MVILEPSPVEEFFDVFANKFTDKDAAYREHKLRSFREDCNIQVMAKTAFDFNLDDKTNLENLFGPERKFEKNVVVHLS